MDNDELDKHITMIGHLTRCVPGLRCIPGLMALRGDMWIKRFDASNNVWEKAQEPYREASRETVMLFSQLLREEP